MNFLRTFFALVALTSLALAAPPEKESPPKPAVKRASKSKTTPKPGPTMKDLAVREARKFDTDYNGEINGIEVLQLQNEYRNNPNSRLYMFDENSDHVLDGKEMATIKFKPAKKPEKKP